MNDFERRIRRLEERIPTDAMSGPIPILSLPLLPEEDRQRFRLAEQTGDEATVDDIVLQYTGTRLGRGPGIRLVVADVVERTSA